jgi:hypothetical protein
MRAFLEFLQKDTVLSLTASAIQRHPAPLNFHLCGRLLADSVLNNPETWFYEY